jgi:hypothetical protein
MEVDLDTTTLSLSDWLADPAVLSFQNELTARISHFLFNQDPTDPQFFQSLQLLTWLGTPVSQRPLLQQELIALNHVEDAVIPCGWTNKVVHAAKKTASFVSEHKVEIAVGAALLATALTLGAVTGCTVSYVVSGVVIGGAGSIFASDEPSPSPLPILSKDEAVLLARSYPALPKLDLPSPSEFLVTPAGIWANGQFYSNDALKAPALFAQEWTNQYKGIPPEPFYPSLPPSTAIAATTPTPQESVNSTLPPSPSALSNPSTYQPIPPRPGSSFTRHFLQIFGREILDSELVVGVPIAEIQKSHYFTTAGERRPSCQVGGINGIDTPLDYAIGHAEHIKQFTPNQSIDWVYNNSHGPTVGVIEVYTQNYLGISINTADLLLNNWIAFHQANKDNPNARYLQISHSQGSAHVYNALLQAPKEIRDRVFSFSIAPAKIISNDMCFRSLRYASKKDIVHLGELLFAGALDTNEIGISRTLETILENRKGLILLNPHPDATGIDHDLRSPTFITTLVNLFRDYYGRNGEYE